jgi:hypothetical protein
MRKWDLSLRKVLLELTTEDEVSPEPWEAKPRRLPWTGREGNSILFVLMVVGFELKTSYTY